MNRRALPGAIRAKGDGEFDCRAIAYGGPPDSYGSIWAPGCANKALALRLPVVAWAHDWRSPIGKAKSYSDRPDGLYLTCRLDVDGPDVPLARQAYAQLKSGTLTDVSVGFTVPTGGRRDPTPGELAAFPTAKEVITAAEVDEVSLVLRGAVPGAEVVGVRARTWRSESERERLERERRAGIITAREYEDGLRLEREVEAALATVADRAQSWRR